MTRQRDLVAGALFAADGHLTVEALQRRLRGEGHPVGTATLYRTLDLLVEAGLARRHDFGEGTRRFEAHAPLDEHGHCICTRCGAVTEFTHDRVDRMLGVVADEHGFRLERHRVELHGLCRECQRRDLTPASP
ncbi:MAG TPA: Fur family transcriptional regulator [Gemmatimonadales bacterium]|nr:Fur family transcriptional regulator [Gemmatimonadales bacterium]